MATRGKIASIKTATRPSFSIGTELRLHGRDPDAAEAAARALDLTVLASAMDKPHGLREALLIDPAGYLWVSDVSLQK